jgi:hypothetical protein
MERNAIPGQPSLHFGNAPHVDIHEFLILQQDMKDMRRNALRQDAAIETVVLRLEETTAKINELETRIAALEGSTARVSKQGTRKPPTRTTELNVSDHTVAAVIQELTISRYRILFVQS